VIPQLLMGWGHNFQARLIPGVAYELAHGRLFYVYDKKGGQTPFKTLKGKRRFGGMRETEVGPHVR